ncbi:gamma-glutamylcyclotransferase [Endozoicomonas sp. Mp262]|uniref:gamma-glutamylcyclotransferase family protein n=1 Tax=Endozoicomonas sp. Mp262 TaxID=2919499 RepID=UPI0021D97E08
MAINVFVYGSLLFDEIVVHLTGQSFHTEPALLINHARYAIHQKDRIAKGPAIIYEAGKTVNGKLLIDITPEALAILDKYESGDADASGYERVTVSVILKNGSKKSAQTYRAIDTMRPFLYGSWSQHDFKENHLAWYLMTRIPTLKRQWELQ